MRIVIVEDEPAAARRLARLLQELDPAITVAAQLGSVAEAVRWLGAHAPPDLIFLDIELGDGLGFEIAAQVPIEACVIFTTAYDEYALRAFELNSVDYLLKPVRRERLARALARYQQRLVQRASPELVAALRASAESPASNRFLVRRGPRLYSVTSRDIAYFYRDGLVYLVTTSGERFALDLSLDRALERLEPGRFLRLDRRFVASIEAVREVVTLARSRLRVKLAPPPPFDPVVSQERAATVKAWLGS